MFEKFLNLFISEPKSELQIVLDYIDKYNVSNVLDTDPVKDQSFNVGGYVIQFSTDDEYCQFGIPGDKVPMFIFSSADDIKVIRQQIVGKLAAVS